jgi:hypothetical protein
VKKYNFTHDFFILNEENKSLNQKTHAPDCSDILRYERVRAEKQSEDDCESEKVGDTAKIRHGEEKGAL